MKINEPVINLKQFQVRGSLPADLPLLGISDDVDVGAVVARRRRRRDDPDDLAIKDPSPSGLHGQRGRLEVLDGHFSL